MVLWSLATNPLRGFVLAAEEAATLEQESPDAGSLPAAAPQPPPSLPRLIDAEDLGTVELPPLEWLLPPFIVAKEGIILLHGRWGSYKTPAAFALGAAVATGRDLWGFKPTKGRVLFIQADTPHRVFLERVQSLADAYNVHENFSVYFAYPGLDFEACTLGIGAQKRDMEIYAEITAAHRARPYDLIIIDSLRTVHTRPDKDSEVPPLVYRALQRSFPGASILLIHHDRKAKADDTDDTQIESFSGSQAWANHATVTLKISKTGRAGKEITLSHSKSQAGPLLPDNLHLVSEDGIYITLADQLIEELATDEGLTGRALDEKVAAVMGVSPSTARRRRLAQGVSKAVS